MAMAISPIHLSTSTFPISIKSQNSNLKTPKSSNPNHTQRRIITCFSKTPSKEVILAKNDLLELISDEERGVKTEGNPSKRAEIIKAIDALESLGKGSITTSSLLSGTWRMLWTTEKEQLFIIKNAGLFGTETGDVLQVIDVEKGVLNNVITFPPSGVFFVRSKVEVASPQRVNFRFTSAVLRGEKWDFGLPPFGQGWHGK
ncbi:hypothetical protein GIB67_001193 [Kingdonia uniflora]|uniref:Plastid lipid-associated protein/fibrillin conserved domain-containing protein n=1 Tax=Kingdonia uniflora TaxID=39325 RepID=A0A7J7LG45_9MAGN|nr:hypothetical protein GIB67_001193 [Kingdonia uniflora]